MTAVPLHKGSASAVNDALQLFDLPPTDTFYDGRPDVGIHPHFPRDQPHGICGAGRGCLHRFESQLFYHEAATEETEWHRPGRR